MCSTWVPVQMCGILTQKPHFLFVANVAKASSVINGSVQTISAEMGHRKNKSQGMQGGLCCLHATPPPPPNSRPVFPDSADLLAQVSWLLDSTPEKGILLVQGGGGGLRHGTASQGNFAFQVGEEIFPAEFFLRNLTVG